MKRSTLIYRWPSWDLGRCPWYLRVTKAPGHDPEGTCDRGCYEEPSCQTCEPNEGWPSARPRPVVVRSFGELAAVVCTCYLGDPDDPTRDEEACRACDASYWSNPVAVLP